MEGGRPVLEGPTKLVGVDGKLESKVVGVFVHIGENLYHRVLPEHIPSLEHTRDMHSYSDNKNLSWG